MTEKYPPLHGYGCSDESYKLGRPLQEYGFILAKVKFT